MVVLAKTTRKTAEKETPTTLDRPLANPILPVFTGS